MAKSNPIFFFQKLIPRPQKPLICGIGHNFGQETAEKELLDKNRESGPVWHCKELLILSNLRVHNLKKFLF